MNKEWLFNLPENYEEGWFDDLFSKETLLKRVETNNTTISVFDTFDWRLFNRSLVLLYSDFKLNLHQLSNGELLDSLVALPTFSFIWDLPESLLRAMLEPIVDVRALLRIADFHQRTQRYVFLNSEEKTIAKINLSEIFLVLDESEPSIYAYLRLIPLRGYLKASTKIKTKFLNEGLSPIKWKSHYCAVLEASGVQPGSYSSKLNVQLEPGMHADLAMKRILLYLLETIRTNESGIKNDIDAEFLHDHRVAIRRTRSALSQMKFVFPQHIIDHFREVFSDLGGRSNNLRDLDVYLLAEGKYRQMLPIEMQDDITPLFDYLKSRRKTTLKDFIAYLDSPEYKSILEEWEVFLNTSNKSTPKPMNAACPILELACERILKRFTRVVKDGKKIGEDAQDDQLHALRIECKKLRYLLEFFSSLFPPKRINELIEQLKKLQDNLGEFNDLSVQVDYLLGLAEEVPLNNIHSRRVLIVIGFLVEKLRSEQDRVKAEFSQTFNEFYKPANRKSVHKLFTNGFIET